MKASLLTIFIFLNAIATVVAQTNAGKYKEVDKLLATGLMTDAKAALEKLQQNPKNDTLDAEYWLRHSKASYALFRYEDAQLDMEKAIVRSLGKAKYYFEKGLLFNKLNNLDSALAALQNAVRIERKGEYFYWKGILNQRLLHTAEAEMDYRQAIVHKFERAELYTNLAILLSENGSQEEALLMLDKAVAMDNTYPKAFAARSKVNLFLLNVDSACADSKTALQMRYNKVPDIPDSVCKGSFALQIEFAGAVLMTNKYYKEAARAYTTLIDSEFSKSDPFLNRGFCFFQLKDYPRAEKDYLQALTLPNPATDLLYDNLSLLYFEMQDYSKSIEYSTKRILLNPKNHVPYIDRGLAYRKLKNYKLAAADFDKSLEIKPDFFRAFGYRSFLHFELGEYNKSYDDASKSVALNYQYGYGYLVLAQAKMKLGMSNYCLDFYSAKKYGEPGAEVGIKEYCK